MMTHVLDLSTRASASGGLAALQGYLAQIVGEPFRFARISYGDELTLHFGDLKPARSAQLGNRKYGSYIFGTRGSTWKIDAGSSPLVYTAGSDSGSATDESGLRNVPKEEFESTSPIRVGSRAVSATAFAVVPADGFALQLTLSDGSSFFILLDRSDSDTSDAESDCLPEIADWELASPRGLLSAWPGPRWTFEPSRKFDSGSPSA